MRISQTVVKRNLERQEMLVAKHREAILDGSNPARVELLGKWLDQAFEEFEEASTANELKTHALMEARVQFIPECIRSRLALSDAHRDFILAVRVEAGVSLERDPLFLA